jgi:hypothetical protein
MSIRHRYFGEATSGRHRSSFSDPATVGGQKYLRGLIGWLRRETGQPVSPKINFNRTLAAAD